MDWTTLKPVQALIARHFFNVRHLMLMLPRQEGKTELLVRLINSCMMQADESTFRNTTLLAKNKESAKKCSREKFQRIFDQDLFSVNTEVVVSKISPASCCYLQGMDKEPENFRGGTYHFVGWSEVAFARFERGLTAQYVLDAVIKPTMRKTNGYSLLESTMNGPNHWHDMWNNAEEIGYKRIKFGLSDLVKLGLVSEEEYLKIKKETQPDIFLQEYECECVSFAGKMYNEFTEQMIRSVSGPKYWQKCLISIDWGYKDATCILFAYVQEQRLRVFDEIYVREKTLEAIFSMFEEKLSWWGVEKNQVCGVADHDPGKIDELTARGYGVSNAEKVDVLGNRMQVKELFYKDMIDIDPRCTYLIKDLSTASWHPVKLNEIDEANCTWGHYDAEAAMRYLVRAMSTVESDRPIEIVEKSADFGTRTMQKLNERAANDYNPW